MKPEKCSSHLPTVFFWLKERVDERRHRGARGKEDQCAEEKCDQYDREEPEFLADFEEMPELLCHVPCIHRRIVSCRPKVEIVGTSCRYLIMTSRSIPVKYAKLLQATLNIKDKKAPGEAGISLFGRKSNLSLFPVNLRGFVPWRADFPVRQKAGWKTRPPLLRKPAPSLRTRTKARPKGDKF